MPRSVEESDYVPATFSSYFSLECCTPIYSRLLQSTFGVCLTYQPGSHDPTGGLLHTGGFFVLRLLRYYYCSFNFSTISGEISRPLSIDAAVLICIANSCVLRMHSNPQLLSPRSFYDAKVMRLPRCSSYIGVVQRLPPTSHICCGVYLISDERRCMALEGVGRICKFKRTRFKKYGGDVLDIKTSQSTPATGRNLLLSFLSAVSRVLLL